MWQTSNQIVPQTKEPFSAAGFLKIFLQPIIRLLTPPTTIFFFFFLMGKLFQIVVLGNFLIFSLEEEKTRRIKSQKPIMFQVRTLDCGPLNTITSQS